MSEILDQVLAEEGLKPRRSKILEEVIAEEPLRSTEESKPPAFFPKSVKPLSMGLAEMFTPEKVSLDEPSGDQAKKILGNAIKELGGFASLPIQVAEQMFHPEMKPPEEEIPSFLRGTTVERPYALGKGLLVDFPSDVLRGWRDILTGIALYPQAQMGKLSPEDEQRYREVLERLAERPLTPVIGALGARGAVKGVGKLRAKAKPTIEEFLREGPKEAEIAPERPVRPEPRRPVKEVPKPELPIEKIDAKTATELRTLIRQQNKTGARWQLRKNPKYGERKAAGGIDDAPYVLSGTDLQGRTGQKLKGDPDFLMRELRRTPEEKPAPKVAPKRAPKGRELYPSATDRSVRDLPQQAFVFGDAIRVNSKVGRAKISQYVIPISEWQAAARSSNPAYAKAELVKRHFEPTGEGGFAQAQRLRDSQVRAIDAALAKTKSPVPPEVLADYPDLAAKGKKAPIVQTQTELKAEIRKTYTEAKHIAGQGGYTVRRLPHGMISFANKKTGHSFRVGIVEMGEGPVRPSDLAELQSAIKELQRVKGEAVTKKPVPGEEALRVQRELKARLAKKEMEKGVKGEAGAVLDPMREISQATSEMIEKAKAPPEIRAGVAEGKKAMIEHDRQIRDAEFTSKKLGSVVDKNVPKDRQMLMVHAYEHKMRGKYWDQLEPLEKKLVELMADEKTKLNKFIKEHDVLEMMPQRADINHIFHHWINPESGKPYEAMYGKFSKGLPQAKQRTIPTYEAGMKADLKPATNNLGKLIGLEWESVMRAHQTREMVKTVHNVGADPKVTIQLRKGKKPKPIRMIERWDLLQKQGLTEGYKRRSYPCLDKPITFKDASGTMVRLKGAIGVRKEIDPFFDAYIRNPEYKTLDRLNFASKNLKLGMSLFHPVQLGFQEVCNWRMPFVHIPKGLRLIKELDPDMRVLYKEGLDLWKGFEDVGYRNQFFKGATVLGKTGNVIAWPVTGMRKLIFDVIQPGMKASFAHHRFQKLWPEYQKKGLSKEFCARDVVKAADGHFSHEHYKRSLLETNRWVVKAFFSPGSRRFWQRALLSFTWQRSHVRVAGSVGKSFLTDKMIRRLGLQEMGPIKADYRKYALGAATLITTVDAYNYMATQEMDGEAKHIWQNPKGKGFAVRALWNAPDGSACYFRPLKSVFEVAEWVGSPFKKAEYKLSPWLSAAGEQFWPSKYKKEYEGVKDLPRRMLDFTLEVGTPIQADKTARYLEGKEPLPSTIAPFFGFPTSQEKEKGRRERKERKPR